MFEVSRFAEGRYERAEIDFTESLEKSPQQTESLLNRALARLKLGKFQEAADDLTLAVERGRTESLVYLLRSQAWQQLGEEERARRDRQTGLKREPVSLEGWIQRATVRRSEDPDGALADLNEALRLDPQSRQALQNKAHVLGDRLGRPAEAIETLDTLLASHPRDVTALMGRAVLNARLGRRDAALSDARVALSYEVSGDVYYRAACVFAQLSQGTGDEAEEAVKLLGEAAKRDIQWAAAALRSPELLPIAQRPDFRRLIAAAVILSGAEATPVGESR